MDSISNPQKETNILLLGETGVGKSTFINAFANYLTFDKLDDVTKDNVIFLIPAEFTVTDQNFKMKKISIRTGKDNNEVHKAGQSSTQSCRSYNFLREDKLIRLIDTPGMGDTNGIDKDAKNFDNILRFISNYTEIHGICILLLPNNSRLTATFHFCIKQLLCHLHKSASKNIVFLFTNSRGTFYSPGDTAVVLQKMLKDIRDKPPYVDIKFRQDNTFCLDNEGFRFMAALIHGIVFDEKKRKSFSESWDTSVSQCKDLINYIRSLESHKVLDTLSVNEVRNLIITLAQPLADISENIQINLGVLQEHKDKIKSSIDNISELQNELYIPVVKLEQIPLDRPQTVCASSTCYTVHNYEGQKQIGYISECHSPCYLDNIPTDIIGPAELINCTAMRLGVCNECGCPWSAHMHIRYKSKQVQTKVIDKNTYVKITTKAEAKEKAEAKVKELDQRRVQLQNEQVTITKTCANFGHFLRYNAITPYNDSLKDYLDHLIETQKSLNEAGSENTNTISGLEKMKQSYMEELKILKDAMTSTPDAQQPLTPSSISKMANDLYNLEMNGPTIKKLIKELNAARAKEHFEHREITYQPPPPPTSYMGTIMNRITSHMPKLPIPNFKLF